jgi:hypothetical protein
VANPKLVQRLRPAFEKELNRVLSAEMCMRVVNPCWPPPAVMAEIQMALACQRCGKNSSIRLALQTVVRSSGGCELIAWASEKPRRIVALIFF